MKTWTNERKFPLNRAWLEKRRAGFVVRIFGFRIAAEYEIGARGSIFFALAFGG